MQIDVLNALWSAYRARQLDMTIHPDDQMHGQKAIQAYVMTGESALRCIYAALASSPPTESAFRILDFGCGHGRVARHIRAFFPSSTIYFSDADEGGREFCAKQFNGWSVPSSEDFSALDLPDRLDLIWVGSVFTHIDYDRMKILFEKLFSRLSRDGLLIATFHGHWVVQTQSKKATFIAPERWAEIAEDYRNTGFGHRPYKGPMPDPRWGVSVATPERVLGLADSVADARLSSLSLQAWANLQDVAAWVRL